LDVKFPQEYPFKPPRLRLDTKIWNLNWHPDYGVECFDILGDNWSPAVTIFKLLSMDLLGTNDLGIHLNHEAYVQWNSNRQLYESTAREWTKLYARDFEQERIDKLMSTLFKDRPVELSSSMDESFKWNGRAVDVVSGTTVQSSNCMSYYHAREKAMKDLFEIIKDQDLHLPPGLSKNYDPATRIFHVDRFFKRTEWTKPTKQEVNVYEEKVTTVVPISTCRTYFLSYKEAESRSLALNLWTDLGGSNTPPGAWLDIKNPGGQNVSEMKAGIEECKYFILILSLGYFDSNYSRLEVEHAIHLGKEAIMVYNTDNMAKQHIGSELAKAREHGIELEDWPSAIPMSTDINIFKAELITQRKPVKLVRKSKDKTPQSELVKIMCEGDKEEKEMPLPNVKPYILGKVNEYIKYHHSNPADEIEKPLKSANMREVVSEWDASFVEIEQEHLFELILAANYMDIKPLLDLTCAKVASMIKGKSPEEIRQKFNIKNDFTPEEEEVIRAENKWAEDS